MSQFLIPGSEYPAALLLHKMLCVVITSHTSSEALAQLPCLLQRRGVPLLLHCPADAASETHGLIVAGTPGARPSLLSEACLERRNVVKLLSLIPPDTRRTRVTAARGVGGARAASAVAPSAGHGAGRPGGVVGAG